MKERPILFAGVMVRAILDGTKTQTRRVILDPDNGVTTTIEDGVPYALNHDDEWVKRPCPHGQPGDQLWVREAFSPDWTDHVLYKADCDGTSAKDAGYESDPKWKPSIHMPRAVSRIQLEITDVRAQRVQDITDEDAIAEGMKGSAFQSAGFMLLWDSLNEKRGYGWGRNPWVWAITFKRIKP